MSRTAVIPLCEVSEKLEDGDELVLQYAIYRYADRSEDRFYRFIRRGPDGKLKAQRGQCGIPNLEIARRLMVYIDPQRILIDAGRIKK